MGMIRANTVEEFSHPISTHVAPLFAFEGLHGHVAGTAVLIAPGLAMTARHVIDDLLGHFGRGVEKKSEIQLDMYIYQANVGAVWYVAHINAWVGTDIAILSLRPRNDIARSTAVNRLPMTVDPPSEGSEVTALGYPDTKIVLPRNDFSVTELKLSITPTVSSGKVLDVHLSLRDSVSLRFPCFSVDAAFLGGMSGGAVFNQQRELCGLVCAGGEGELGNYSNAVSIWPSMIIPVTLPPDAPVSSGIECGHPYKVHDLARLGHLDFRGHERIEFFKHDNGTDGVRRLHY